MHILIDAHLAVREVDGVARYLIGLLGELPKLDRSIRFTILTLSDSESSLPGSIFELDNVSRRVVSYHGPTPKQHLLTPRIIREVKPDIYHHPQFDLPYFINVPTIVTIHDLKYIFKPEFLKGAGRLKSYYIRRSILSSARRAEHVIAVSGNTLEDLVSLCGLDRSKVSVIYHGVDLKVDAGSQDLPQTLRTERPYLLFVGTRRPHKNITGLIRAFGLLRKDKHHDIELVIAGKGYADYSEPESLTAELDLKPYIHFFDFVPDEYLPALYEKADVFVLPSFYEGFGIPVIEAMAQGTPVVASNVSSLPEIVADAGLLCDPNSPADIAAKIDRVISDEVTARQLADAGRKHSTNFSWSAVAELTLNAYIKTFENRELLPKHE